MQGEKREEKVLYVYIDESGTPSARDAESFYVGVFVSTERIPENFFDRAFQELQDDDEFESNRLDQDTISRGYFHASEDSKNAHSYSCRQIANIMWPCEFYVSCMDKQLMSEADREELNTESKIHQHFLTISQMEFIQDRWDKLEVYIAERAQSFTSAMKDQWQEDFVNMMAETSIESYWVPIHVPCLELNVCGGDNVGVQVCDFLLWAVQRRLSGKEIKWVDWVNLCKKSSYDIKNNILSGHAYYLYRKIEAESILPLLSTPTEADLTKRWSEKEFINATANIEVHLKALHKSGQEISNVAIRRQFEQLISKLANPRVTVDDIQEMARIYLLIADEIPFYDANSSDDIERIYFYKKLCSVVANKYQAQWIMLSTKWIQLRHEAYKKCPELLFG